MAQVHPPWPVFLNPLWPQWSGEVPFPRKTPQPPHSPQSRGATWHWGKWHGPSLGMHPENPMVQCKYRGQIWGRSAGKINSSFLSLKFPLFLRFLMIFYLINLCAGLGLLMMWQSLIGRPAPWHDLGSVVPSTLEQIAWHGNLKGDESGQKRVHE